MPQSRRKVKRARSAGGVVFRRPPTGAAAPSSDPAETPLVLLLQHETGKWMLPKGTIEPGETPEAVALREVAEETGIHNVRVVADLGEERYTFFWRAENTYYDKTVHYYLLEWLGGEEPRPQREEGFLRCEWTSLPEALERIKYKETRQVVRRAQDVLSELIGRPPAPPRADEPTQVRDGCGGA